MKTKIFITMMAVVAIFFCSCKGSGEKFIGKYVADESHSIVISKADNKYVAEIWGRTHMAQVADDGCLKLDNSEEICLLENEGCVLFQGFKYYREQK